MVGVKGALRSLEGAQREDDAAKQQLQKFCHEEESRT